MKFFSPLNNEKFRKFIFAFFLLSSLLPILIVIFIAINYVSPILYPEQAENLWRVFIYALLVMFLFPSLGFLLLFQRMISLESLTEEIKAIREILEKKTEVHISGDPDPALGDLPF